MVKLTTTFAGLIAACGLIALAVNNNDVEPRKNLRRLAKKYYSVNDDDYFTPEEVKDMNQKLQSGMYATAYVQNANLYGDGEEEEGESGEGMCWKPEINTSAGCCNFVELSV